MELVILLTVAAAIVWVLAARGLVFPNKSVGMTIFWILMVGAIVALLFEVIGGGPPSEVQPG
ncbi:MAG TPA: hypothetical protein VK969_12700 [Acidimicrobiia bacterium]|nr:hypothetical protein [Acidimicrobiia bacterium]